MKISIADLKKAITWVEVNSKDTHVNVTLGQQEGLVLQCQDKYDSHVEIKLFENSNMMPKIRKEDILR